MVTLIIIIIIIIIRTSSLECAASRTKICYSLLSSSRIYLRELKSVQRVQTYHVTTGGEDANTLHLNDAVLPSGTTQL